MGFVILKDQRERVRTSVGFVILKDQRDCDLVLYTVWLIRYVSSILSIDIRYYHDIFRTIHQIGLKPTEICDVEWLFPGVNFMI